jgi:1A family penicillin-binding protein
MATRLEGLRHAREWLAARTRGKRGALVLASLAVVGLVVVAIPAAMWLGPYEAAIERLAQGGNQTLFFGADGEPWFPLEEHRRDVPLARVSRHLQDAVIAIEDHRFQYHHGIDPLSIARSVLRNVEARGIVEGGSTLTQQLARTLFLSRTRSVRRKLQEMALAILIERRLSKPQILEMYLNRIYLGGNVYGVEAMARNLFGRGAESLTLAECAFLAGLIRMPSALSPWSQYEEALERSRVVLKRMREEGFVSADEERAALLTPPVILPEPGLEPGASGYAGALLRQQFRSSFGDSPGFQVHTTFLPSVQAAAEAAVVEGLHRLEVPGLQAALVAIDPATGDVLALIGGEDFRRAPFNRAVEARRQPGSAFKPIVYAAALEAGWSPLSRLSDLGELLVEGHEEWQISNASGESPAWLTLREALVQSNNRAAVELQAQLGSGTVLHLARELGLEGLPDVPSLALGTGETTPLELTAAYAPFANGGFAVTPRTIATVEDGAGSTVLEYPVRKRRVLREETAFQVLSMLQDVVDRGTGSPARSLGVDFPAAGKTGTSDDFKDAWFVGFTSSILAGVWVGLDRPAPIAKDGFGSRYALPIWADFMKRVADLREPGAFQPPPSLREVLVCRESYLAASESCPAYREYVPEEEAASLPECRLHGRDTLATAGLEIGGFFKKLGRGIGKIFRR